MKLWAYDQIALAAAGAIDKTIADWPYLRQALEQEGIRLPGDTLATTITRICKLVLDESKVGNVRKNAQAVKDLKLQLLARDIYASDNDIAEVYCDYCTAFAGVPWVSDLSNWQCVKHVGPLDFIAARVGK